jgi:uncharacterized protein YkwD
MPRGMFPVRARLVLAVVALLCVALALPALAPARVDNARAKQVPGAHKSQEECANVDVEPAANNLDVIRAAVLCLHNRDRAARGLPALKENPKLRQAALGHSGDMVQQRYFAHDTPSGVGMLDRVKRAGYLRPGRAWSLGENIAWGTGNLATPAEIHKAWMNSAGHRANILRRGFREIGIGIVLGNPAASPSDEGATFTADFGVLR